ncbi:MAG: hypothetical protein RRC34_06000 [Lentisphaeria bacterium]|nr:hypothetical protein [Lentisphaeria bacterium]
MRKKASKAKKILIGLLKAFFPAVSLLFLLLLAGAKALDLLGDLGGGNLSWASEEALDIECERPDGSTYIINNSPAEFNVDLQIPDDLGDTLFPSYAQAAESAISRNAVILPSTQALLNVYRYEDQKLLELLQTGTDSWQSPLGFQARRQALLELLDVCAQEALTADPGRQKEFQEAAAYVAGALLVNQTALPDSPSEILAKAHALSDIFFSIPTRSKPVGNYTTSPELTRCFLQDRFLAQGLALNPLAYPAEEDSLHADGGPALAWVLRQHPKLAATFKAFNDFDAAVANPAHPNVMNVAGLMTMRELQGIQDFPSFRTTFKRLAAQRKKTVFALISYAFSKESALIHRIYTEQNRRPAKSGMGEIIQAVKDGRLTLTPTPDSGWYDYQWHVLEPMLLPGKAPEAKKLHPNARYTKHLEESFKSGLAAARETNIKELPALTECIGGGIDDQPLVIRPDFRTEPTPTVFLRKARAYAFLLKALNGLAADFADGSPVVLTLKESRNRCLGIYYRLCLDIGLPPDWTEEEAAAALSPAEVRDWLQSLWDHPGMLADARFTVPVWFDSLEQKTFCWGIAGVKLVPLKASYRSKPVVLKANEPTFESSTWYLPVAIFGEYSRPGNAVYNRQEWQHLCDQLSQEQLKAFLDLPTEPYFGRSLDGVRRGLKIVLAVTGVLLLIVVIIKRKLRRVLLTVLFKTLRWGGLVLLALALLCLISSRFRTRLFCESLLILKGNYMHAFAWRVTDQRFDLKTAARFFLSKADHPRLQTRYNALALYSLATIYRWHSYQPETFGDTERIRDKLLWTLENDPNPGTRGLALSAFSDFSRKEDIPLLVEISQSNTGEAPTAIYHLKENYMTEPGVADVFIQATRSGNRARYHAGISALTNTGQPWALDALLDELQRENHSEMKLRGLLRGIDQMVKDIPFPGTVETASGEKRSRQEAPSTASPPPDWLSGLKQIITMAEIPVGIRIRAVRRLPVDDQWPAVTYSRENSPVLRELAQLAPVEKNNWIVILKKLGLNYDYDHTLEQADEDLRETQRHTPQGWNLERLLAQVEENTRSEKAFQKEFQENPFAFPPDERVNLRDLCACLSGSDDPQWRPLALLKHVSFMDFADIAWFLEKTLSLETASP